MRNRLVLCAVLVTGGVAHAETAVKVPSCLDALYALSDYWYCLQGYDAPQCTPPPVSQCWDFEPGYAMSGSFAMTGNAFLSQPTVGDNVAASRVVQWQPSPVTSGTSVYQDLSSVGGDYWNVPYPIGNQGTQWIGTFENRPTLATTWNSTQGDGPTGTATSPSFIIDRNFVSFLIGGGCEIDKVFVELQVWQPEVRACGPRRGGGQTCITIPGFWLRAFGADTGEAKVRTGRCSELMFRDGFRTDAATGLLGRTGRIVIADNSSGSWGHINVDHIETTNAIPTDVEGVNQPLWGFADTHAHPGNHLANLSLGTGAHEGYLLHGDAGSITTNHFQLQLELPTCDGTGHETGHGARTMLRELEEASLGSAPNFPKDCSGFGCQAYGTKPIFATGDDYSHWGTGVNSDPTTMDLKGWPYWTTRAHQTMHLTWIQRAYLGGQRVMFAAGSNTEALAAATRGSNRSDHLSDYGALRRFKNYMKGVAAMNANWMEIAYTPADVRRIVRGNKLAIILATEVDDLGSHCTGNLSSPAADDPDDHGQTKRTEGADPFNQVRDTARSPSCTTAAQWKQRIDNLYAAGYRVIMPVHLSDNDLGGTAIYDEKFNSNTRFMTGNFIEAQLSSTVDYVFPERPGTGTWSGTELGWTLTWGLLGSPNIQSVTSYAGSPVAYNYAQGFGHINKRHFTSLTGPSCTVYGSCGGGAAVIEAIKAHGMILDLAHMGQIGRMEVLGLGTSSTISPLAQNCDLSLPECQATAYPAISSHAGLREMAPAPDFTGGGRNEAALTAEMIARISAIGGIIGIGTTATDVKSANEAAPGAWPAAQGQTVSNNCGGSSKTFAQSYLYALRRMGGKGITLGTDINGLEDRLNPRFGTQGCYSRGNIPYSVMLAADGSVMVSSASDVPINYRPSLLALTDDTATAGEERFFEALHGRHLNYAHYNGVAPSGGRFRSTFDPPNYRTNMNSHYFGVGPLVQLVTPPGQIVSGLPALNASVTGNRTFDLNYDGLAHYGMLPDMMQDARVVGLTQEQLGPMFQGAEAIVQTWEKACRFPGTVCN